MNATERMAEFIVTTRLERIPDAVIASAKRAILDTLGVTVAGASEPVIVTVRDDAGLAVPGAVVTLSVGSGPDQGNLTIAGGPEMKSVSGTTDAQGGLSATYVAANVQSETLVVVNGITSHADFPDPVVRSTMITVLPAGVPFLSLRVDLPLGDRVQQGSSIPMEVTVTDQDGGQVPDAWVTVSLTRPPGSFPGDPTSNPSSGTAAEMATVILTASTTATTGNYAVDVWADKAGFVSAFAPTFLVTVVIAPTPTFTITVDTVPPSLVVSVNGFSHTAPHLFLCPVGAIVTLFAASPQGAGGTRHPFASWSNGGSQLHDITCQGDATFVAVFSTEYEVTLDTSPAGQEMLLDGLAHGAPHTFWCSEDAEHTIEASAVRETGGYRYRFASWSDSGTISHTWVCDAPAAITATYTVAYRILVDTSPAGLQLVVDGVAVAGPHVAWCDHGSTLRVDTPIEQGGSARYRWRSWSDGGARSHAIPCSGPMEVRATFDPIPTGVAAAPVVLVAAVIVSVAGVAALLLWRRRRGNAAAPEDPTPRA